MAHESLEDFNKEGILSNLLSIEEHLIGNNGVKINSWCAKKHYLLGSNHHAFELQQLLSKKDPELSKKIGSFREKWRKLMDTNPTPAEVRDLRNEWRSLIGEETSKKECGTVCSLDKAKNDKVQIKEQQESQIEDAEEPQKGNGLFIAGLLVIIVGTVYLIERARRT